MSALEGSPLPKPVVLTRHGLIIFDEDGTNETERGENMKRWKTLETIRQDRKRLTPQVGIAAVAVHAVTAAAAGLARATAKRETRANTVFIFWLVFVFETQVKLQGLIFPFEEKRFLGSMMMVVVQS
jgi:hypothetical protein